MAYIPKDPNAYGFGRSYKSASHYNVAKASRADWKSTGYALTVVFDFSEIEKLRKALTDAAVGYDKADAILAQSLNRAGDRVRTQFKRAIKEWTGIRRFESLEKRMQKFVATPAKMRAGVRISGRHFRITKLDFGASWRGPGSAGVRHSAWNRSQTASGAFMPAKFRGGANYGGGLAFKRIGGVRKHTPPYGEGPIKPLWGPHPVKEIRRHYAQSRAIVEREAKWFLGESTRRADVELRKAKAKYGL